MCIRMPALAALLFGAPAALAAQTKSLPQQIADAMVQLNGGIHTGFRFAHAKGLVLTGTFTPAPSARTISRAAHLTGSSVPVTVRRNCQADSNSALPSPGPLSQHRN